jgi:uncharacterized protein (DUF885 family)
MTRYSQLLLLGLSTLALWGCNRPSAPPPAQAAKPASHADELGRLVERYWEESAALSPWYAWGAADLNFGATPGGNIDPQSLADSLALERRYLQELAAVPRADLDAESQLTYELFRRERMLAIEGFTYPFELTPVNPYQDMALQFALMAPAAQRLALSNAREFDNWRARTEGFVRWMNQAIVNLREGVRRGYTLPRVLVDKSLPPLAALGQDGQGNAFFQSMRPAADAADSAERTRLSAAMTAVINDRIIPSYRALHDFLQREYLPRSRTSVALSALPLGESWYAYLVKRSTGGAMTPEQLHALGMAEVERSRQRVSALLGATAFAGNPAGFLDHARSDARFAYTSGPQLEGAYREVQGQVAAASQGAFSVFPRADFILRSVEPYRESIAEPLSYRPRAPNGIVAAALYVNLGELDARPAMGVISRYLRQAVPGHHYQLELQRERSDLPRFRRFGGDRAFVEGWGLYAATLGEELGVYHDPEDRYGALSAQMLCAAGLVVDTGVHAQGWTRKQAVDYLHAQMPIDEVEAAATVDRIIALPGEALACTVGFLEIQGLRATAQQKLGPRFDPRAFHAEMLKDGALPLDLLESRVKAWLVEAASNPAAGPVGAAEPPGAAAAPGATAAAAPNVR